MRRPEGEAGPGGRTGPDTDGRSRPPQQHRPPIAAHAVVAGGRTAALVRPDGEIDWWCAPDFDSPPLLWSLLDPGGGAARWLDVRPLSRPAQPAGPVVRTVLARGHGRVECRDALVGDGPGISLVRLARSLTGPLELVHELSVGGFDGPWARWDGDRAQGGTGVSLAVSGGRNEPADGEPTLRTVVTAGPGEWAALVVSVGGSLRADAGGLLGRLDELEAAAELGRRRTWPTRHHPERAADALAVLDACTYGPTGAVVAAVTTSLPEAPGGDRQFDYRYSWLRDASLGVSVAALLGRGEAAAQYLAFLQGVAAGGGADRVVVDVRGGPVPDEREVVGVAGWAGAQPVRVGNAAADQIQHDAAGLVVESVSVYLQTGGSLDHGTWALVRTLADAAARADSGPSSGIWELREPRMLVSADIGRWVCLDRALWVARGWRPFAPRRHWKLARDQARARVLGALRPDGSLPQAYDADGPAGGADASALMAVVFGMLRRRDPRARCLVAVTLDRLGAGPFLYRYPPGSDDGFRGREGAFLPASWWAVAALAMVGDVGEAEARADELCATLPRLLSEEVDPDNGASLGNVPLVWSHAEMARALYLLDAARLRRRFGLAGLWAWRLARFVRMRRRRRRTRGAGG